MSLFDNTPPAFSESAAVDKGRPLAARTLQGVARLADSFL